MVIVTIYYIEHHIIQGGAELSDTIHNALLP